MIRSSQALAALLEQGRSVARLTELTGGTHFRWVMTDTNEAVHGSVLKAVTRKGLAAVISRDLCGDPMQYGAPQ